MDEKISRLFVTVAKAKQFRNRSIPLLVTQALAIHPHGLIFSAIVIITKPSFLYVVQMEETFLRLIKSYP